MKAIAEYFRDLAADDRFFGAEPPQPDTEMLHKIAERTIQRQVATELAENGVILRQTESGQTQVTAAPALAVEMPQAPVQVEQTPDPKADVMSSITDVPSSPQPTRVHVADVASGGDTVAQKLQRIRAVVARENATSAYSEDQHADGFASEPEVYEDTAPSAFLDAAGADVEEDEPQDELPSDVVIEDATQEIDIADIAPALEDTVVAHTLDAGEAVAEVEAEEVIEEAETAVQAQVGETPEPEAVEVEESVEADSVVVEDLAASEEPQDEDTSSDDVTEDAEPDSEAAAQLEAPTLRTKPRRRIVVQKISRSDMEAAKAAKEAELPPELEAELMAELAEVEADLEDTIEGEAVSEEAEDAHDAVEKAGEEVGDDEAAQDDDVLARLNDSLSQDTVAAPEIEDVPSVASVEDDTDDVLKGLIDAHAAEDTIEENSTEAEAEAEAEVEPEVNAETVVENNAVDADVAEEEAKVEDEPARKTLGAEAEDDAIERLMSTTGSRLDHDESSVRRASIAHLKAAVAATKADASIAEAADKRDEEELDQYRDDLARVVKPSRPVSGSGRSDRPAPLVLVSEQRIDRPEEAPQEAAAASIDVRPRRVTHGNLALQDEDEFEVEENVFTETTTAITYPEYAAQAGALELPDLLEAAAGHYMVVEGAVHFTRPMLMRKLATIQGPDAPSREDGLRAFGTLLRTGKIVKTDNGKFVLSKSSQFAPEAL